ncbi:MAG: hypothetical protein HFJ72_08555 [Adlercreutzia sp.]|nr:hypothetical protein [Adlercreutzia sp.]
MATDEQFRPEPESAQLAAPGWGDPGEAMTARARAFRDGHPGIWRAMVDKGEALARRNGYVSVKYLIEYARNELFAQIRNADSPAYARLMREDSPVIGAAIRTHRSKCDAFPPEAGDEAA